MGSNKKYKGPKIAKRLYGDRNPFDLCEEGWHSNPLENVIFNM